METVYVSLPTPRSVQSFVDTLTDLEGEFEFVSGKYLLDGRSLMGIFSLDRSKPLRLRLYDASETNIEALKPFIVENITKEE